MLIRHAHPWWLTERANVRIVVDMPTAVVVMILRVVTLQISQCPAILQPGVHVLHVLS
jgi:hypothetical protein